MLDSCAPVSKPLHLTGAAILVLRGITVLQAAPAGELFRYAAKETEGELCFVQQHGFRHSLRSGSGLGASVSASQPSRRPGRTDGSSSTTKMHLSVLGRSSSSPTLRRPTRRRRRGGRRPAARPGRPACGSRRPRRGRRRSAAGRARRTQDSPCGAVHAITSNGKKDGRGEGAPRTSEIAWKGL
jgi:hypothetical protein